MGQKLTTLSAILIAVALVVASCSSGGDDATGATTTDGTDATTPPGAAGESTITRAKIDDSLGELDAMVEYAMETTGVPGIAVAVVYDDEVVHAEGYGVRDVETGEPTTPETIFEVASLSKSISSTVMAGAVGDGHFDWDDPVSEYNPDLVLSDPWVTENVTFADLFAHRSGLPGNAGNQLEAIGHDRDYILDRLRFIPLDPIRSTYSYSNFAMTAGGESAAVAAGTTWEDLADDILFGPAGMDSSSMHHDDYAAADDRAELHVQVDGEWESAHERDPDPQAPAGGVNSNVIDLGEWLRLQINGGELDGTQIIDEEALDQTHIPHVTKSPPRPTIVDHAGFYGLGWNVETDETGAIRWNHSGAFSSGAATQAKILPSESLGIVVITNGWPIGVPEAITDAYIGYLQTGEWSEDTFELWAERMSGVYGEPEDPGEPPIDPTPALDDDAYVGTYTNGYFGDAEVVRRDGNLTVVMGPAQIEFALTHLDGSVFTLVDAPELPDFVSTATFEIGADGSATSITLSAFDEFGFGTMTRG